LRRSRKKCARIYKKNGKFLAFREDLSDYNRVISITPWEFNREVSPADKEAMDRAGTLYPLSPQLGIKRVGDWLDAQCGGERPLSTWDLAKDEVSFIRFIYSVLYADSHPAFGYKIEDTI
jgi:hypothetical protein